jgi:Flp pilus assembly CpaE family ATPase
MRQRYGKERVQVVVSRYDTAAEIGHEDVERVTGSAVQHLFPSNYRVAVAAMNKGRPLVVENHSQLAASYRGLARSLGGVPQPAEPKAAGLLGRLTGRR